MSRTISLSQYLTTKEKKTLQFFIFLLDDEYSYLNNETTWLNTLQIPTYVIRMPEADFHTMDFAVHPKIVCTRSGKELLEINGLPNIKFLQYKISQL